MPLVTLAALAALQGPTTVSGKEVTGMKSDGTCVYAEVVVGTRAQDGSWAAHSVLYQSERTLQLTRDGQTAELSHRKLRAHIAPTLEVSFAAVDDTTPPPVRDWLKEHPGPAVLAEYCLLQGQDYHVALDVETYMLPPSGPDGEPGQGRNEVLLLSDQPLVDGKPPGARTPAYDNWSY